MLVCCVVEGMLFVLLVEQMIGLLIYGILEDVIVVVKVVNDFSKSNDKLVIKVGLFDGKVMDKVGV